MSGARRLLGAAGQALLREDPLAAADAIVVLGGAPSRRAPAGRRRLLAAGWAPRLLTVGGTQARGGWADARRTRLALLDLGVPEAAIEAVAQDARGTADEARVVVALAAARGWTRLIVVTSPYHCRRAGMLFGRRGAAVGVDICVAPAREDPFDPGAWWVDGRQRRLARNELLKQLAWTLRLRPR